MAKSPRIRTRGGYTTLTGKVSEYIAHPEPFPNPYEYHATYTRPSKKLEVMWDTVGFKNCDFNPCWHEEGLITELVPFSQEPRPSGFGYPPIHRIYSGGGHYADPLLAGRSVPLDLAQWLDDFGAQASYHFTTAVQPIGSLINFLIEAKELCELNIKVLNRLWDTVSKAIKTFRRIFEQTGKFWLAWNFAIKPTLRDVENMVKTLEKAKKRLAWLKSRNHKNTKVKYRQGPRIFEGTCVVPHHLPRHGAMIAPIDGYVEDPNSGTGTELGVDADPGATVELELSYTATVRLSSWGWVRFDIDDAYLDEVYGLGIVISVMQGLYNPLSIIWEAMPFSWLIDWFRRQRDLLQQKIDTDLSPLASGTLLGTGWAIDVTIFGNLVWVVNRGYPNETRYDAGDIRYRLYSRQPGLPTAESSPFVIPTSWYQASILAALIAQFRRRR